MGILARIKNAFSPAQTVYSFAAGGSLTSEHALGLLASQLFELADPDEVLKKVGKSRRDLRTLETDDEISSHLETRLAACQAVPWRLDDSESRVGAFIWEQLDEWVETIIEAGWQAVPYGYSVAEIVWRKEGGLMVPDRISEKPFEWFTPTRTELRYHSNSDGTFATQGQPVDTAAKFMLTRRKPTYRNPRGEALLSRLYWPWFFRSNGWKFWAKFLERHGSPLMIGTTKGQKSEMADAMEAAIQSAVLAINDGDTVTTVPPGNVGEAFDRFSDAVDRRIAKVILGQTLTSGTGKGGSGSFALGKVHNEVREDRRDADLRMIRKSVQWFINASCRLNFGDGSPVPRFSFETDSDLGTERADRDAKLVQSGALKLKKEYFLRAYDFEEGDFEIPSAATAPKSGAFARFASRDRMTPAQRKVEALGDAAIEAAGDPLPPDAVAAAIRDATDPGDLIERLSALIDPASVRPDFLEAVERALFAADVIGHVHAAEESGDTGGDDDSAA